MENIKQTYESVDSRITNVTVYLSGAQVTKTGSIVTAQGAQNYVFKGLPYGLQPESIQVSADYGMVIRSVKHTINYLQPAEQTDMTATFQNKLDELNDELLKEQNKIELGNLEESFFSENMRLAGNETGLKTEELKSAVLFYNERMASVRETRLTCAKRIEKLSREISQIQAQIGGYHRTQSEPVSEITITAAAAEETIQKTQKVILAVSYFVYNTNWRPFYDIRVKDVADDIALQYKANSSSKRICVK